MDTIVASNVVKEFRSRQGVFLALDNVSLRVKKGEIFGLLGPNGAGKTTLINCITRLLYADSGEVRVLGEDVKRSPDVLQKVNSVAGDSRFHWVLNAEDIMDFYGRLFNVSKAERKNRGRELLEFFGLWEIRKRKFAYFSTGERMRLIFAKSLINRPELLLLDEPTLGLDPNIATRLRKEILRINKVFGTTILLTSHYMAEVEQLCGKVAFINHGRITDTGPVSRIRRKWPTLEKYFLELSEEPKQKHLKLGRRL